MNLSVFKSIVEKSNRRVIRRLSAVTIHTAPLLILAFETAEAIPRTVFNVHKVFNELCRKHPCLVPNAARILDLAARSS
jgi:hypothetical protein